MANFVIILLFLTALLKSLFFSNYGLNFFDYGESLHNGERLLEGAVLYKDAWAFLPPADNYFPALILKIFGKDLLAVRYVESFMFAFFIVIFVLLIKNIIKPPILILLSLALIFADLNSYLLFFQLFFYESLLLLYIFLKHKKYWLIFLSGVILAIGSLFRHDMGLVTLVTVLISVVIVKKKLKNFAEIRLYKLLLFFFTGLFFVLIPVLVWFIQQGTLSEFLYLGFSKAPSISRILSTNILKEVFTLPLTESNLFQMFSLCSYFLYILIYINFAVWLKHKFKSNVKLRINEVLVVVIFIFGLLQIPYAFSVIEMGHLVKAGIPALILGGFFIQKAWEEKKTKVKSISIIPLLIFILASLIISAWWISFNDTKVDLKYGSIYLSSKIIKGSTHPNAQSLNKSLKFIDDNSTAGDYIFVAPYHALIYFLSDRKSSSKFNNFAGGFVSYEEQDEVIKSLVEKNVKLVVYDPVNAPLGKKFSEYSPKIHQYIMENYIIIDQTNQGWLNMRRKDE